MADHGFPEGAFAEFVCPRCHRRTPAELDVLLDRSTLDDPTPRHPCECGEPYPDIVLRFAVDDHAS